MDQVTLERALACLLLASKFMSADSLPPCMTFQDVSVKNKEIFATYSNGAVR